MADDRERILAEWSKRYEVEGGAEELSARTQSSEVSVGRRHMPVQRRTSPRHSPC